MSEFLLVPPVAFVIYLVLVGLLSETGRRLAGTPQAADQSAEQTAAAARKSSIYAGGEAPPEQSAAPGYAPFFGIALFFAMLHVGALIIGIDGSSPVIFVYLAGLALTLLALILG